MPTQGDAYEPRQTFDPINILIMIVVTGLIASLFFKW